MSYADIYSFLSGYLCELDRQLFYLIESLEFTSTVASRKIVGLLKIQIETQLLN